MVPAADWIRGNHRRLLWPWRLCRRWLAPVLWWRCLGFGAGGGREGLGLGRWACRCLGMAVAVTIQHRSCVINSNSASRTRIDSSLSSSTIYCAPSSRGQIAIIDAAVIDTAIVVGNGPFIVDRTFRLHSNWRANLFRFWATYPEALGLESLQRNLEQVLENL